MRDDRRGATSAGLMPAAVVGIVAVAVPPRGLAMALVGAQSPLLDRVIAGVWCFKGLLALHALLLVVLPRWSPGGPGAGRDAPRPARGPSTTERERVWDRALGALVIAALGARLIHLGEGLWFDEIWTLVQYVELPWGELVVTFDTQNQHFLYSLAAKAATALPLSEAAALRLPAALFGAGSIAALYVLGVLVTSRREAFLAAAVLAFSSHHVWFSQNARGYTGVLFFSLLATWLFLRMLRAETRGWKLPLLYAAVAALAVYTHLTAALTVVAHALVFGVRELAAVRRGRGVPAGPRRAAVAGLLLATTFSLQLYALVLPQLPQTLGGGEGAAASVAWTSPLWLLSEMVAGLARGVPGGAISLLAVGLIGVVGLVGYARRDLTLVGLMILPALLTAIAMIATRHNLWPRFFFASAGFAVLIGVRGVFEATRLLRLPAPRTVATAALALATAASALTIPRAWGPKQDHEGAAEYVDRLLRPGDAVVVLDMTEVPFEEYLGRSYRTVRTREELLDVERAHARTWLLYSFPTRLSAEYPEIWSRLQTEYREVTSFPGTVEGGAVVLTRRG